MTQPKNPARDKERSPEDSTEVPWKQANGQPSHDATSEQATASQRKTYGSLSRFEVLSNRYQIVQLIGMGGMGEVYEVEDLDIHDHLALKTLRTEIAFNVQAAARFKQEIRLLRQINHPNVCRVFDVGYHPSVLHGPQPTIFFTMELLRGKTLAEYLQQSGPLPVSEALPLLEQIVNGLEAVHQAGIVHRDLKSSNIILVQTGQGIRPVISDFGLALASSAKCPSQFAPGEMLVGTPEYMAPEQLEGADVTAASDIYSLGVVIYYMVTGKYPFTGDSRRSIALQRLETPPVSPRVYVQNLDPCWESAILRCLKTDPKERFLHPAEISQTLRKKNPIPVGQAGTSSHKKLVRGWIVVLAGILLCAALAGALLWNSFRTNQPQLARKSEHRVAVLPFTVIKNDPESQAFANGLAETMAAGISPLAREHSLQVIPIAELRARQITTVEKAREEFGADVVITGSLQRSGRLERVTVVLIDAAARKQLGGNTVDFFHEDPFAMEDHIVANVLFMLEIKPTREEEARLISHGTVYPQAYSNYLKGLGYLQDYEKPESIESAIEILSSTLNLDPNYGSAYAALGEAYWFKYEDSHNKDWVRQAREACERSVRLQPGMAEAHACLGNLYEGTGQFEKAAEEFNLARELDPADASAYRGLAKAYESLQQTQKAEEIFQQAIRLMPQYWGGYSQLGAFYYRQTRYEKAAAMFQKVILLAPDNYRGYSNLGGIYLSQGRYGDAVPLLRRSAVIQPSEDAFSNLATSYFHLRQFPEAAYYYDQAVKLKQQDYMMWGNLASAQYKEPETRDAAMASYRQAILLAKRDLEVNPKKADVLGNLADYYSMLGDKAAALQYLHRALQLAPNDALLDLRAAEVYNQLGETDRALEWLSKTVAVGYSRTLLRDTPVLDNLREDRRFQKLLQQN
jgi:serine/threonine-protein kinase